MNRRTANHMRKDDAVTCYACHPRTELGQSAVDGALRESHAG